MKRDFLLEIGTEEIPARFMEPALQQMREKAEALLNELRLDKDEICTYGTPRRLVLYIKGLAEEQRGQRIEVRGPARKAAFDAEGRPTKAAEGFARSQGVRVEDLVVRQIEQGEYVFAVKDEPGRPTVEVLPDFCLRFIRSLSFPKPMRWGYGEMRFARPIRWLLALFGEEVVPFELEGAPAGDGFLRSGRVTYGHRFLSSGPIEVRDPDHYFRVMRENYVIVDQEERKREIWRQVQETAARYGGRVDEDPELLEENAHLLEYPTALCGTFAEEFLALPEEVIITPMREHQRYFPVRDETGRLLNRFIALRNGDDRYLDIVREGNEKVLRARLSDARFFFEEDLKQPLIAGLEKLKKIVFQEKLGTLYEKVERLERLAAAIFDHLGGGDGGSREDLLRAARLAKADLVTNMVYEFPELQGIMGREYALRQGEKEEVARAIFEHYLPRFADDELPASDMGRILSVADKADTLAGCFAIGIQPTGSQDPYALRRQALGIIHILSSWEKELSLRWLLEQALAGYREKVAMVASEEEIISQLLEFFRARLRNLLLEEGFAYDTVDAVLAAGFDRLGEVRKRLAAVEEFKKTEACADLHTAYTRANNLAKKAPAEGEVNPSLFQEQAEEELYQAFNLLRQEGDALLQQGAYGEFLARAAAVKPVIDNFFAQVMVMIEDEAVKNNRLRLLREIRDYLARVADPGLLQV